MSATSLVDIDPAMLQPHLELHVGRLEYYKSKHKSHVMTALVEKHRTCFSF